MPFIITYVLTVAQALGLSWGSPRLAAALQTAGHCLSPWRQLTLRPGQDTDG